MVKYLAPGKAVNGYYFHHVLDEDAQFKFTVTPMAVRDVNVVSTNIYGLHVHIYVHRVY